MQTKLGRDLQRHVSSLMLALTGLHLAMKNEKGRERYDKSVIAFLPKAG